MEEKIYEKGGERINPNYKSEKINGRKMCCVCGCKPTMNEQQTVGSKDNPDVVCGDGCMDVYYGENQ